MNTMMEKDISLNHKAPYQYKKETELRNWGFKKDEHFRIRRGKVDWNLSSMTVEEGILFNKYLHNLPNPKFN